MRILIAYDGSALADAAIDDLHRAGLPGVTEAMVVSVAHDGWPESKPSELPNGPFRNPWKATLHEAENMAEAARVRLQWEFPAWKVSSEALFGNPAKILLKTINVLKPDLVVVGSHGRSVPARLFLGSVSAELVHHAHCSVRVVRRYVPAQRPTRILVATDGSDQAEACINAVARRWWPTGTQVRLLAVAQPLVPSAPIMVPALEAGALATEPAYRVIEESDQREKARLSRLADTATARLQKVGLITDNLVIDGDPRYEINAEADRWKADCVFVGARGLGAIDRLLLGSVSGSVVAHAHCTVEVVRH